MRTRVRVTLLAAAAALAGCVPSLHPIYGPDQLAFDPGLVGAWVTADGEETWVFTQQDQEAYRLVYTDRDGKEGRFLVHRTDVEGAVFLDLFPREPELDAACLYKFLLFPVHTFLKVDRDGDTLNLAVADPDWLGDYLEEHPDALAHETVNDGYLVTAGTADLRSFFSMRAREGKGFGDPMKLERKKEAEPAAAQSDAP